MVFLATVAGCPGKDNSTGGGGVSGGVDHLSGGGSTFVWPIMKKWTIMYHEKKKVEVDYAQKGSGDGVQQMIGRKYMFGCTDAPMNEDELKQANEKNGDVLHIPLIFGAVVPIYNLPELKGKEPLKFTGEVLGQIYTGKITKWNEQPLKDLNPGVNLPDRGIVVVRRNEASGTTFIFTSFLGKTSPSWKETHGEKGAKDPKWFAGAIGETGNPGVAKHVKEFEGSIGYVELEYAVKDNLAFGAVENRDKKFVTATAEAVTAAAQGAEIPDDLRFLLVNQPGEKSYPICGVVWAVLYVKQPAAQGKTLVDFLSYCVHDGQQFASTMNYAPLPEALVRKIDDKLKTVKME
jgi:phosphate transport system substrate-binding protein